MIVCNELSPPSFRGAAKTILVRTRTQKIPKITLFKIILLLMMYVKYINNNEVGIE